MNILKRKHLFHAVGLVLILLTFIPPLPKAMKIILALIPLAVFLIEMLFNYVFSFLKKEYVNEYLSFILATAVILCTGNVTQAALTVLICSFAVTIFKSSYDKAQKQVDELCRIIPKKARLVTINGVKSIPLSEINIGDSLVVSKGDIIPADGTVANGVGTVDYTNIFGPSRPVECAPGTKCYSGGTVLSGRITVHTTTTAERSVASVMETKIRKAHNMSRLHAKISNIARIFQPAMLALALIMLISLWVATKKFGFAANIASVIIIASTVIGMTKLLPLVYHISLLKARRKGVIFRDTASLEAMAKIQTLSPNEPVSKEQLALIDETGVIPARNGKTRLDAVMYRSKAALTAQKEPVFKIAMGFFSSEANLTVYDGNIERVIGAIRLSSTFKNVFIENAIGLIIEKLALIALVFFLNITPALAILIELAAWMVCLINATRKA